MTTTTQSEKLSSIKLIAFAATTGTILEWFDYLLYGTLAALVFNKLFFPNFDPATGVLLSFASFSIGFLARPLGSVVFGYLGDRIGRRPVFIVTVLLIGLATVAIGMTPDYQTAGVAAPILLVLFRVIQGFALGGEYGGAVTLLTEFSNNRNRGVLSSLAQASSAIGSFLATGSVAVVVAITTESQFLAWGWRVPFFVAGGIALAGSGLRFFMSESAMFSELVATGRRSKNPVFEVFRKYRRAIIVSIMVRLSSDVAFYIFIVFSISYVTKTLGLSSELATTAVLIGTAIQAVAIVVTGALSDRFGRRRVYAIGAVGVAVWVFIFFPLLGTRTGWGVIVGLAVALAFQGTMSGPQSAFIAEMFPTRVRTTGVSIGYQFGGITGGAAAPLIAVALLNAFDSWVPIAIYMALASVGSLLGLALGYERAGKDLESIE